MLAWKHIDTARIPGHDGNIHLYRRGFEYSIRLDNYELMNSRQHGSERALAELACARIKDKNEPKILIGGLGMGYTLAAALENLTQDANIVVAELVPAVVDWNQGPLAHLAGFPLKDERVSVRQDDVWDLISNAKNSFDAIVLDVDNGPEGLTRPENDRIYGLAGLKTSRKALKKGGVLAVWSAGPDVKFKERLSRAGFSIQEVLLKTHKGSKRKKQVVWLAS